MLLATERVGSLPTNLSSYPIMCWTNSQFTKSTIVWQARYSELESAHHPIRGVRPNGSALMNLIKLEQLANPVGA